MFVTRLGRSSLYALVSLIVGLSASDAVACPDGWSSTSFGVCLPNAGPGGAIDPGRVHQEIEVERWAPVLKNYILVSRQEAFNRGTYALPPQIVQEFTGFYASNVLSVRFGIGGGNDLSLQAGTFQYGERAAIVLDTVIVFRSANDASTSNIHLWAHELAHVEQYRAWGIDDFTKRYIRDFNSVENEAERRAQEFLAWRNQRMGPPNQPPNWSQPSQNGTMCVTPLGVCPWVGPVGWNCVCAINGQLPSGVIR